MNTRVATEIVEFKLVPGTDETAFIQAVSELEGNFHSKKNGFMDTELSKGVDGKWFMIQHWATMADLKDVVKLMMKDPITLPFRQCIDPTSVKMTLLEQLQVWKK